MARTCGTCAQCLPVIGHCDERNDTVDLNEEACRDYKERDVTKAYTADGKEILTFAGVKLLEAYDRIVKYEQLERILKDMWYWVRKTAYAEQGYLTVSELKEYARQFKECGVILDD